MVGSAAEHAQQRAPPPGGLGGEYLAARLKTGSTPASTRVAVWVGAVFVMFLFRAALFSTWISRGPEVKRLLGLNSAEFGLLSVLYPLGGLIAVAFAGKLLHRFGSRSLAVACYLLASLALAALGPAISAGWLWACVPLLMVFGAPIGVVDFVAKYEGNLADKAARRSVFSAIHGAFGLGMLGAAALTGRLSGAAVSLSVQFELVAAVAALASVAACLALPRHPRPPANQAPARGRGQVPVWRERRTLTIGVIGFTFILAETAAGAWAPIALTSAGGFTESQAAYAVAVFWVLLSIGRLTGGLVVDALGRYRAVQLACLVTCAGIVVFMFGSVPYLGLLLWGGGMAVGFPMSVSAMGDDPARASARINLIIIVAYLANITVGPALGVAGQLFGLYAAFAVPLALLLIAATLSGATREHAH